MTTIQDLIHAHTATARKACLLMAHEGRSARFVEAMAEVDAIADQIREARNPQPPLPGFDERSVRFLAGMCGVWP